MLAVAGVLTALAVVLMGPAASALSRATWPSIEPRAGLVLWQAIGLASGLAVVGALLAVAVSPLSGSMWGALSAFFANAHDGAPLRHLDLPHASSLVVAFVLWVWLSGVTVASVVRTWRSRSRHRVILDLVGTPMPAGERSVPVRILEHSAVAAYCLPGLRARVVLTTGAVALLSEAELAAVLAHEQAHVVEHHDLVTLPFSAWEAALPWLAGARRAKAAVGQLIEMVADDRACHRYDRRVLASALARVGLSSASAGTAPNGALAVAEGAVLARVERLLAGPSSAPYARRLAYSGAVALLLVPTVLLWLAG